LVWFKFILCLAIILFAGTKLARYGDAISEKTGLGGVWIGVVLLAAITSMPELVTDMSAAVLVGIPDLAMGDLFGSCLFNLTLLALLDVLYRPAPVLSVASPRHKLSAVMGILLITIAGVSILAGPRLSWLALGWVGVSSIIIIAVYFWGIRQIFRRERQNHNKTVEVSANYSEISLSTLWFRFALAAAAVIGAGMWISFIGEEIVLTYGWDASFVGTLFLAIGTSLPEFTVTIAALRLGAIDMAVADVLGSNMFDIVIIAIVDIFYIKGPILSLVSVANVIPIIGVIVMSLLVILGLRWRQQRKTFIFISWYGLALLILYIAATYGLFIFSRF